MPIQFDIKTATKAECLARAETMLRTGIRAEENGKAKQTNMALDIACRAEDAAFDGRE